MDSMGWLKLGKSETVNWRDQRNRRRTRKTAPIIGPLHTPLYQGIEKGNGRAASPSIVLNDVVFDIAAEGLRDAPDCIARGRQAEDRDSKWR
jgi:hypothetical protein